MHDKFVQVGRTAGDCVSVYRQDRDGGDKLVFWGGGGGEEGRRRRHHPSFCLSFFRLLLHLPPLPPFFPPSLPPPPNFSKLKMRYELEDNLPNSTILTELPQDKDLKLKTETEVATVSLLSTIAFAIIRPRFSPLQLDG